MQVIDGLKLRIPDAIRFTELLKQAAASSPRHQNRGSRSYYYFLDLRNHGLSALLHVGAGEYAVEFKAVAKLSLFQLRDQLRRMFEVDPAPLLVQRLDLGVDIFNLTPSWFHRHLFIPRKRSTSEFYGNSVHRRSALETFTIGARRNQLRIYDKLEQLRTQWSRLRKSGPLKDSLPIYLEAHDFDKSPVTRVERQYMGKAVPTTLNTFGKLVKNVGEFNPFSDVRIRDNKLLEDQLELLPLKEHLFQRGLHALIEAKGQHGARQYLNKRSQGNASRYLKRGQQLMTLAPESCPDLYGLFVQSIKRQVIQ